MTGVQTCALPISDIVMVGVIRNYSGTFDGQGHALTVNWNHTSFVDIAPFKNVAGATIKNLHVKGQNEATGNSFLSGLIQNAYGTVTVSGCVSDVDIKGSSNLAGMIQMVNLNTEVIITDCVVKGALNSATKREENKRRAHILNHFEEAIKNGRIKDYQDRKSVV